MPKNKPPAAGRKVKKVLKRLRRGTSYHNNNYGNDNYGNGNCNYGQPFDPNLPPGGVLYFQPFNFDTTTSSSSSITIINNTISTGGYGGGQQNPAWSSGSEFPVWEHQYQDPPNNDMCMPFDWQLPCDNNDDLQWSQGTMGNFWEDASPEAISNPQQCNQQPKKFSKSAGVMKQNDNRLKSQDSAIQSSVFANQTEVPPMVPRRSSSSTNSSVIDNPVNPFETVETTSEDTLFQEMVKPTFNLPNKLAAYNQLVELPLNVQIDKLVESQKLSPEQLRIRWQLAFDLLYLLRYHYPTCEVYGIDSVLTQFKNTDSSLSCDVQLYVDLTGSELTFEKTNSLRNIIQQVKSILGAHRCPHHGLRSFIKMFIRKERNDKVIQFMHEPSQLTCQLTLQSQLPAKRSQLIMYCSKLDPRIHKFIGVLRYWGQFYGVCDYGNNGAVKISEWALLLLGLVYLMEEKKMPPVANLPTDLLKPPSILQKGSAEEENVGEAVMQFMKGFCAKYATLDFKTVAVLPLKGQIIPRQTFLSSNQGKIPKKMGVGAAVCIDPFGCNVNVLEGEIIKVALQAFQVACKNTLKLLEENGGHHHKNSVLDLFNARPQTPSNTQMLPLLMTNDFALLYMTKLASVDKMLESFSNVQRMEMMRKKMYDLWKKFAEEFILEIFSTGFKLAPVEERLSGANTTAKKSYRVSYPFWERMGDNEILNEENYQSQDPIQVEKIKSTAVLVNYLARKGKHMQPLFQEFWIEVEYKFDVNGEGIQELKVHLLKIPIDKNIPVQEDCQSQCNNYATVSPAVFRIIEHVFQPYLIYRLKAYVIDTNWIG